MAVAVIEDARYAALFTDVQGWTHSSARTPSRDSGLGLSDNTLERSNRIMLTHASQRLRNERDIKCFLWPTSGSSGHELVKLVSFRTGQLRLVELQEFFTTGSEIGSFLALYQGQHGLEGYIRSRENLVVLESPPGLRGPYFCLLLQRTLGGLLHGIYLFSHDAFAPNAVFAETSKSAGLSSLSHVSADDGMMVQFLVALVEAHTTWVATQVQKLEDQVNDVERALLRKGCKEFTELGRLLDVAVFDIRQLALSDRNAFDKVSIEFLAAAHGIDGCPLLREVDARLLQVERLHDLIDNIRKRILDASTLQTHSLTSDIALASLSVSRSSLLLADKTSKDSRSMRAIALITMFFLPATFVSSFFGMNFFNGITETPGLDRASRFVWMYFVLAVPMMLIVVGGFYCWENVEKKRDRICREKHPGKMDGNVGDGIAEKGNVGLGKVRVSWEVVV